MSSSGKEQTNHRLPDGNPFQVPDGYFDNFSSRLSERKALNQKKTWKGWLELQPRLVPVLAASTFFFIIATAWIFWLNRSQGFQSPPEQYSEIIEYSAVYFDEYQLTEALTEDPAIPIRPDTETGKIIEYLSTEDISIQDIIDDL